MARIIETNPDGTLHTRGQGVGMFITDEALRTVTAMPEVGSLHVIEGVTYRLGHFRSFPNAFEIWESATDPGGPPKG